MAQRKSERVEQPRQEAPAVPITFMIGVYNEEHRIRSVLEHAVRWADEIVVVNKSSTDKTKAICEEYGDLVKVIDIPYSIKGNDDVVALTSYASYDWIFLGPASEIPTRRLINECKRILSETNGQLDLVYVPRKYYSFGVHSTLSPWSISMFPFLINRKKAIVRNQIHENFIPSDPNNVAHIPYADECSVYHWTHPTAAEFMESHTEYMKVEADNCTDPHRKIQECMQNIFHWEERLRSGGEELFGHYCAWPIYWFGVALHVWEKNRGIDVPEQYAKDREDLLDREWRSEGVKDHE